MRDRAGDTGVLDFEEFVHATAPRLHRAALLLTGGDHHLAEDLTQTTYAKLFAAWRKASRADEPLAYAHTVLTRTFLSHRRLRRSSERPTEVLPEPAPVGGGLDPAVRLDLMDALARLSPHDRTVIVLRYWLDLSVAETADRLDITEVNVRSRSLRALTRLRSHLPDLELEPGLEPGTGSTTRQDDPR